MKHIEIVIINPNSTESMTQKCAAAGQSIAGPGTNITGLNPAHSPASIQGFYDVAAATIPMIEVIQQHQDKDAFVIACFDDTGLDAARCVTEKPVIGIGEAAFHMASLISCNFSVITTLRRSVPGIENNLRNYGLDRRCARVRASEIPVLDLEKNDPAVLQKLYTEIEAAIDEDKAEAIVLGCAGMVALMEALQQRYGLPVIDGVTAAVALAEAAVRYGLKTSKIGGYAG